MELRIHYRIRVVCSQMHEVSRRKAMNAAMGQDKCEYAIPRPDRSNRRGWEDYIGALTKQERAVVGVQCHARQKQDCDGYLGENCLMVYE